MDTLNRTHGLKRAPFDITYMAYFFSCQSDSVHRMICNQIHHITLPHDSPWSKDTDWVPGSIDFLKDEIEIRLMDPKSAQKMLKPL